MADAALIWAEAAASELREVLDVHDGSDAYRHLLGELAEAYRQGFAEHRRRIEYGVPVWRGPRLLVDFDGVVHQYRQGWADGTAYDEPMPGAKDALAGFTADGYEVVIFSTRPSDQIEEWLARHDFPAYKVTKTKEPAVAIIDDRAVQFLDWESAAAAVRTRYPVTSRG